MLVFARVSVLACAPLAAVHLPECGRGRSVRKQWEEVETARWGPLSGSTVQIWGVAPVISALSPLSALSAPSPLSSVHPVTGDAGDPRRCSPPPSPAAVAQRSPAACATHLRRPRRPDLRRPHKPLFFCPLPISSPASTQEIRGSASPPLSPAACAIHLRLPRRPRAPPGCCAGLASS